MTTEERTATEERLDDIAAQLDNQGAKLDDIAARLMKLEALLGDRHVGEALEGMRREGWMREIARGVRAERMADPALADDPSRGDD